MLTYATSGIVTGPLTVQGWHLGIVRSSVDARIVDLSTSDYSWVHESLVEWGHIRIRIVEAVGVVESLASNQNAVYDVISVVESVHINLVGAILYDDLTVEEIVDYDVNSPLRLTRKDTSRVSESLSYVMGYWLHDTSEVTESLSTLFKFLMPVSDSLDVAEVLHVEVNVDLRSYSPDSSVMPAWVRVPAPVVTIYDVSTPATTITLPRPDFGDSRSVVPDRVINRNPSGTVFIGRKGTTQVMNDRLTLRWSRMRECSPTRLDVTEIRAFVTATLGRLVRYTDHDGFIWAGFIENPDTAIRQISREAYSIELVIYGVLVP